MEATGGRLTHFVLPVGVDASALPLLIGRALRGFCDGFIAVLLPAYLLGLGFDQLAVGLISSATLIGSALATILVSLLGSRFPQRRLLIVAAILMAATGSGFAGLASLWPLLIVAFIGTLNPSSGEVSLFPPLEQARLAEAAAPDARTALFARYSLIGAFSAAIGALAAVLPGWLSARFGLSLLTELAQVYVASESGVLSIFKVTATGVTKVKEGFAGPTAHSLGVDPITHEVYLPLKDVDHRSVMRVLKPCGLSSLRIVDPREPRSAGVLLYGAPEGCRKC